MKEISKDLGPALDATVQYFKTAIGVPLQDAISLVSKSSSTSEIIGSGITKVAKQTIATGSPAVRAAQEVRTTEKATEIASGLVKSEQAITETAIIEDGIQKISEDLSHSKALTAEEFLSAKKLEKPSLTSKGGRMVEKVETEYWKSLMPDPDHGNKITVGSIEEVSAAIRAEKHGLLQGPLKRDTMGGDFVDVLGKQWDAKRGVSRAPNGKYVFKPEKLIKDLKIDIMCGENVLLDLTRLEVSDYEILSQSILEHLTADEIKKIVVVFK